MIKTLAFLFIFLSSNLSWGNDLEIQVERSLPGSVNEGVVVQIKGKVIELLKSTNFFDKKSSSYQIGHFKSNVELLSAEQKMSLLSLQELIENSILNSHSQTTMTTQRVIKKLNKTKNHRFKVTINNKEVLINNMLSVKTIRFISQIINKSKSWKSIEKLEVEVYKNFVSYKLPESKKTIRMSKSNCINKWQGVQICKMPMLGWLHLK